MSLQALLGNYQSELDTLDASILSIAEQISKESLLKDPTFVKYLQSHHQSQSQHELETLSLSQLSEKSLQTDQNIAQVRKLDESYSRLTEITTLVNKAKTLSDLLDFQQLFSLFRDIRSLTFDPSIVVYKQISKQVDLLYEKFLTQLNEFIKLLLPDETTIKSLSVLNDFNSLIVKNDIKLDHYLHLRNKWDQIVDKLLGEADLVSIQLKENDYDLISIEVTETTLQSFFKSLENFIVFINYIDSTSVKQYLNSKINKRLIEKVTANISIINEDKEKIEDLRSLSEVCHATNWNVLSQINTSDDASIKENLNKLYVDWLVDGYVENIRKAFGEEKIVGSKYWQEEPYEDEPVESEVPKTEEDQEDGWDDGWDDNWDIDDEVSKKEDPKETKKTGVSDSPIGLDSIKISSLPLALVPIFEDYKKISPDTSYLVTMVKALSLSKYPPLSKSFLLHNDLTFLSRKLKINDFQRDAVSLWNQTMIQFYQELKLLIVSLDLNSLDVSANSTPSPEYDDYEDFVLDDYNLNQLSVVYKWFNGLCQDTELEQSSGTKFKHLIISLVSFINNWLIGSIVSLPEISEYQSKKIATLIDSLDNVTLPFVMQVGQKKDSIESYGKLQNIKFLIQNHLKDIMDRFYQGDLFDISTDELIKLIQSNFVKSELRDGYIQEIIEFRTMN
ncbi:uncharacterized protein CANTADRAFT_5782 [Suhomyces tanzawaensis NRRL Y-17324]|uniref:Retrograde transport protein Dsl1 C-terminal domain-containing protein n=1 Tax=Suhomyces tanzawaensis NRRL Y-17324 TaxID=984487 RepID=A0A1E4SL00_9ASCO|nr:uncharacterized protein CANTADRAFT_5782 [Suhomyces tanzawaensis NRRL Y-17324]ODV80112.1 hypothetical protein CANTADRAFT_5782 [Suhomyces tanzawaensis NRRL Y-17324]